MPAKKDPKDKIPNTTKRIGVKFNKEIEEIKKDRLDSGIDKKRKSTRKLTNLIITHNSWPYIKEDLTKLKIEGMEDEEE